jgi:hypothetical protein
MYIQSNHVQSDNVQSNNVQSDNVESDNVLSDNVQSDNVNSDKNATYPRHDDAVDVLEDLVPRFSVGRRVFRQQVPHVSGLHVRKDPTLANVLQVVGDVVHHLLAFVANIVIMALR